MHIDQYKEAGKLLADKSALERERKLWLEELTRPEKLAYRQGWNNHHPAEFENSISPELFKQFRDSRLEEIAAAIADIDLQFSKV